jgi:multiple sugar transport system permease protein
MQNNHPTTRIIETRQKHSKLNHWRKNIIPFILLVLPAVVFFTVFMIYPLEEMFRISLLQWNGILGEKIFIGLKNYSDIFASATFKTAIVNTLRHVLIAFPGVIIPAFMLGFFLSLRPPGYRFFRTIYFIPVMISSAALNLIFMVVYSPYGIFNSFLDSVGLEMLTRNWLADPKTALNAVIFVDLWADIGLHAVLFFAACSNISFELYEAARIDGANNWTIMWKIAFPVIKDFFGISAVLQLLWLLSGSAQNVLLLTKGGPGSHSLTLGYYLYELAFVNTRIGYSQAIGAIIFFVGVLSLVIIRKITRQSTN